MKVLVIGATGGSGRAAVRHLLARGHEVTAFARRPELGIEAPRLTPYLGDVLDPSDVERAVAGHDAVVVTVGIRENPIRVRLFGAARTDDSVRSSGTRNVLAAMRKHGVRKLVVQTTYGVAETRDKLRLLDALFFSLLLKPQIADTERQQADVVASDLDWVIAQPVHLTDELDDNMPFLSTEGETGAHRVSRDSVGRFLAEAAISGRYVRQSVSLSGHPRV
jgi:putative NADH-flavin reductase